MPKKKVLIDRADADILRNHHNNRYYEAQHGYWRCSQCDAYVHHLIYGKPPKGFYIDHRNGDKRDCRRSNLRLLSYSASSFNRLVKKGKHLRGTYRRNSGRYSAKIQVQGTQIPLGTFDTEREAHEAYLDAAQFYFGEEPRV